MKVLMVSLGCDKNLVDSEVMLGLLHKAGHEITNDEHEAEAVVINTCAFIKDAQEESINTLLLPHMLLLHMQHPVHDFRLMQ